MKNLSTIHRTVLASVVLMLGAGSLQTASAQDPDSGGPTPTPTAVPIDAGASLLLAAGAAYGLKKLRDARR
ncbi:hypothetical protein LJY25_08945 [Hymenobacter sp. BT175]|uniref:PID-CTERM protein-sorting domain-containing protein n=1 Tax=Hymenobacter translucens TaxID=2886507 RepID=UPI001D0F1AAE|nr:hypothetical protein [Hymenobacter translucens]MCC2546567.1 hypothetical protein [Hymenobacter translucens]